MKSSTHTNRASTYSSTIQELNSTGPLATDTQSIGESGNGFSRVGYFWTKVTRFLDEGEGIPDLYRVKLRTSVES